jgi:hypothetical protein
LGRRALVAFGSIILVAWAPSAHATSFKITSTKIDPTVGGLSGTIKNVTGSGRHQHTFTQTVSIGRLELKGTSDGQSVIIDSYCADIFSDLGTGTFTSQSLDVLDLSDAKLNQLAAFLENADALVSTTKSSKYSAAAQLGVWEILNETTSQYSLTSGSFSASGSALTHGSYYQASVVQVANSWLNNVTNNVWQPIAGAQLGVIDASHNQAQIFITHHASAPPSAVPEPASWTMMIGGFGLIGAMLRRQRRSGNGQLARS